MTDYNKVPSLTQTVKEILDLVQENAHLKNQISEYETYNPYKRGKLYTIQNSVDEMVYVGATYQELWERMKEHHKDSKNQTRKSKLYTHMRKLGREKFKIHLLKLAPCKSKWHLETEEYAVQMLVPEKHRLFNPKKRLPIGLTVEEKTKLFETQPSHQSSNALTRSFSSLVLDKQAMSESP